MIELRNDALRFSFLSAHEEAVLEIGFQRTLRIPDDGESYPLPPGLGRFPLRHIDDHGDRVPPDWQKRGGVLLPMYQSEAMWLSFSSPNGYPFAVKIATGKVNAVTGDPWSDGIHEKPQDYLSIPEQPWLDGYCVEKGVVRQFVAMPLGAGYSAEEQITGAAEFGGIQILAYPLKAEVWERDRETRFEAFGEFSSPLYSVCEESSAMGLALGGRMRQEIYDDPYQLSDWEQTSRSRCFVHLVNSLAWRSITESEPPTTPFTAEEYSRHGFPWFDYYSDADALDGAATLAGMRSVAKIDEEDGRKGLPENKSVDIKTVVQLGSDGSADVVRDGEF